ncbi:MAG TPA: FlgD immunoglobulin-like domain containing protein [Bacteroidota bacterium]|nr:FlgD immunoglobulin-like domain containing protein [Bacteroidota bacterium]
MICLLVSLLISDVCGFGQAVFVPDTSTWEYTFREIPGWFDANFSDTSLSLGKAPFGNYFATRHGWHYTTEFPEWSTLYVRKVFSLGSDFDDMEIHAGWDNILSLYINGVRIDSIDKIGFAAKWNRTIPVPNTIFTANATNVIAARVIDYGGGTGFDLELTGTQKFAHPPSPHRVIDLTIRNSRSAILSRTVTIEFSLPSAAGVKLLIYDGSGKLIRRLVEDHLSAGRHVLEWDLRDAYGRSVPHGEYLYKLLAGKTTVKKKAYLQR